MTNRDSAVPPPHARFRLGSLAATPSALRALQKRTIPPLMLLMRHAHGDWGDLCADDLAQNELALHTGQRLFSSYRLTSPDGTDDDLVVWVITEWDRSVTTILLPEDY